MEDNNRAETLSQNQDNAGRVEALSQNQENTPQAEEKEIDLIDIFKKLWGNKKTIGLWCFVGAVLGLVVAFSIPKEYTTKVTLAPEVKDGKSGAGNLGALAAMAGVNIGSGGADAVSPQLYPDIVKSVPFGLSLLNIPLTDIDGKRKFTLEEYLQNDVRAPWWGAITGLPGKMLGAFRGGNEEVSEGGESEEPFRITPQQDALLAALGGMIGVSVDVKTNVITVGVTMQDPMVSAIVADTVVNRLQEYVTDYRTNKARKDLEYIDKLNEEAKQAYYSAQQKYANYLDTHQGMVMYSAQTMRDRLENEATLAFNMFNQTSQQLAMAKAKVQEVTPVYAVISPATVPNKPSAPRKPLILVGYVFLAFVGAVAWILFVRPLKEQLRAEKSDFGA